MGHNNRETRGTTTTETKGHNNNRNKGAQQQKQRGTTTTETKGHNNRETRGTTPTETKGNKNRNKGHNNRACCLWTQSDSCCCPANTNINVDEAEGDNQQRIDR